MSDKRGAVSGVPENPGYLRYGLLLIAALAVAVVLGNFYRQRTLPPTELPQDIAVPAINPHDGGMDRVFATNGNDHVLPGEPHGAYFSNPPTSGWHYADLGSPGVYSQAVRPEEIPHFLEHGGVFVLYTCATACPEIVQALTDLVQDGIADNRPIALAPYPASGITPPEQPINLVAWQRMLSLSDVDEDAIRLFLDRNVCAYNPEGGGWCRIARGSISGIAVDAGPAGFNAVK